MIDKVALVLGLVIAACGLYLVLKREKPVDPPAEGYSKNSKQPDKNSDPPEI